jgi:hypothetical protein
VSGDYYDFLKLESDRLVLAVGDISGKGISAALMMATIHSAVRAYSLQDIPALREPVAVAAGSGSLVRYHSVQAFSVCRISSTFSRAFMMVFPCFPIVFKSSCTKSLGAGHPVDAWLDGPQGTIAVSLNAGWSQGNGELSNLEAPLRKDAGGRSELMEQGLADPERLRTAKDRASMLRNGALCANAGA